MSNTATFPQAKHLMEVFEFLTCGELQMLYASGLLTDLRRCAYELDPTKVDRKQFKKALGFIFTVSMGLYNNTDQIMAALGFPFHDWLTQADFPLRASEIPTEDEIEIIDPGSSFTEAQGLKFLANADLDRPTYEHGIRFAEQYGKVTTSEKKPYVVFLHEPWHPRGYRDRRISLFRREGNRGLLLEDHTHGFDDTYVLAGVRRK